MGTVRRKQSGERELRKGEGARLEGEEEEESKGGRRGGRGGRLGGGGGG